MSDIVGRAVRRARGGVPGLGASGGREPQGLGLEDVLARLDELSSQVDYVRHLAEMTRSNDAMAQRRRPPRTPVRVAFLVHLPEVWYALSEVYASMRDAEDFEPIVISLPRHLPGAETHQHEEFVHERLTAWGIPHLRFGSPDSFEDLDVLRMLDPDLIFRQSQWDGDVPPAFSTQELRWARLCLVPYEMLHMSQNPPEEQSRNTAYDNLFQRNAWLVTCTSEEALASIEDAVPNQQGRQYRVTGHPKADILRRAAEQPRGDQPFTVLWSAHHSIGEDWLKFGTFHRTARQMVALARSHPEWRFVFSAHQALLTRLETAEPPLTRAFVDEFQRAWADLPNTEVFGGGDYAPLFAQSDVLVCDGLSWLMEFQLVNKPVVFLERRGHAPFNELGRISLEGMHRVSSVDEAIPLLEGFAAGQPDPLGAAQREVGERLFGLRGAAPRIVDAIREQVAAERQQWRAESPG